MLARLELILEPENDGRLNINKGSLLHGIIMEHLEPEYVEEIHTSGLNPFTSALKALFIKSGANIKNDTWNTYNRMNEVLIKEVDDFR